MLIEHLGITLSAATSPDNLNVNCFDRVKRDRILSPFSLVAHAEPNYVRRAASKIGRKFLDD
jgi:hypothetical protein